MACLYEPGTEEAAALLALLEPHAGDPGWPFWLHSDETGADYCEACITKQGADRDDINCYGGSPESDSPRECAACGKLLAYMLTDVGCDAAIEGWHQSPPQAPLSQSDAYEIVRILWAAPDDPEALEIARQAVAALPK